MLRMKQLIAISVVILFIGLSFSTTTAKINVKDKLEFGIIGEDGKVLIQKFKQSTDELKEMDKVLAQLMDDMYSATSYKQLINTVQSYKTEWGRFPFIKLLLGLIIRILDITHNFNQLRPVRHDAFIISWGFGPKFNPFKKNDLKLFIPIMTWYYTGRGNLILNSRTLIIDPYPFSIKSLTGRQFGCMTNFAGIYLYRHSTLTDNTYTFILGRVGSVRGFDLSPINVWNQ